MKKFSSSIGQGAFPRVAMQKGRGHFIFKRFDKDSQNVKN